MSKGDRKRQQAREKIAQARALEARRRRRRNWTAGIGGGAAVIIAAVGIALAVSSGGPGPAAGGNPQLKLTSLASLGTLKPTPPPADRTRRRPDPRRRCAAGQHGDRRDRPCRRRDQLPDQRADPLPYPRPPDHLR